MLGFRDNGFQVYNVFGERSLPLICCELVKSNQLFNELGNLLHFEVRLFDLSQFGEELLENL